MQVEFQEVGLQTSVEGRLDQGVANTEGRSFHNWGARLKRAHGYRGYLMLQSGGLYWKHTAGRCLVDIEGPSFLAAAKIKVKVLCL